MSFRLVALTPSIGASPGESVVGRVEIHNDGTTDAVYTISVVGLAQDPLDEAPSPPPVRLPVPAGSSATTDVVVVVPRTLGIGQHAAAFEATSSRSGDRAALTPFTVSIQSVARVELVPQPSTIRARRRAKFHLDVTNHEALPVDVALSGDAPDVEVTFTPPAMTLQPGQRAVARAAVRGPRKWAGERTQHTILVTARGRASSTSVTAAYIQRPLFAHRLRMVVAGLTVVALWLAAIGGAALWLSNRDDGTAEAATIVAVDNDGDGIPDSFTDAAGNPVTGVDTDGDGIPDSFTDAAGNPIPGTDTDGDGIPDTLVDAQGRPLRAVDTDGDGVPDALSNGAPTAPEEQPAAAPEPQGTILRGTVEIDGDPTSVAIALTPIELGAAPDPAATPIGLRAAQPSEPTGKIWSARTTTLNDVLGSTTRRTVAVQPDSTVPGADGVWLFTDVLQGQSYEVSFSSPGYDTQSFVLTPRADGEPIDLDVVMKPSNGSLRGSVVGPSGGLGGAEVRITDGTLEFVTTSESGTGDWSLDAVSTPGIYTVTSTLRGFATAVRQIRLEPGDQPTGIALQMVPGLGTITGAVTSNGTGLGGVTVTASNGETTLTTTSLTEGNIGFYSLPQLPVGAEYTVQAQLDGFVTNSRRVPLPGSVGGVDFSMTSTTGTLTGRVLSSAGGGIESAGLIVSTGDLQFRASTSPTGAFEIDRLPPGDYTITVEHFEHESVTEFTTLRAGADLEPLTITLPRTAGPPSAGTGSLVVSVINEDSTIVPAGINNARVTISRARTNDVRVLQDPSASAVTFENLPIGTWTINVTAAGYNVSAPVTRSVGTARERAEVRLQRLGQASGIMVNSLDPARTPLLGYSVSLFRLQTDTDTVGVPAGTFVANAAGTWSTPPAALSTGVYRVEATSPLGYLVRNDQVLDTSPEVRNRPMTFLVPVLTNAEVRPLSIPPIEADPYPTITGAIYQPRLNGAVVEYDAIDDPSLAVTGVCNGRPVPSTDITISDEFGPTGAPDLFDTFSLTKEAVAEAIPTGELPGTCTFTIEATGRDDATITMSNIVASNGLAPSDRLAAAALVRTPAPLEGTVFWFDRGNDPDQRVPLGNVAIAATAPVITGFASTERTAVIADPRPSPILGPSTTTSASTAPATPGTWTLSGQVFGTSTYSFTTPNFTPGTMTVTINETTRTIPPAGANSNIFDDAGGSVGVELTPPAPGTISGRVTIQTTGTPTYGSNMVRATDPLGAAVTRTPRAAVSAADPGGDFSFAAALAGTWRVSFDDLPNHVREPFGTTPPAFSDRLAPGGNITGVDATYTELATVRVRLFDKTSNAPITADAGLSLSIGNPSTVTGTIPSRSSAAPSAGGVYELTGIPVSRTTPITTPANYTLKLELENYDLASARVGSAAGDLVDARALPLPLLAGQVRTIDLYVESFKEITGSIVGEQTDGSTIDLPLSGPAELLVTRTVPTPDDGYGATFTATEGATPGSFVILGPPGEYQLTPSHPEYVDVAGPTTVVLGTTDVAVAPFGLELRPSQLSVDALTQRVGGVDVDGAVVDYYLGTAPCTFPPLAPPPAVRAAIPFAAPPSTSSPVVLDVGPGDYCLRISKYDGADPTRDVVFPTIVQVTVPTSLKDQPPRVARVVAALPSIRPTLTGRLVAKNTSNAIVELVAATAPELSLAFTEDVRPDVDGTPAPNLVPNSNGNRTAVADAPPPPVDPENPTEGELVWTYEFTNVVLGLNAITAPEIEGYELVGTMPRTVPVLSDVGPTVVEDFVYTLANAPVAITLPPGTYPSLDPAFAATDPERAVVSLTAKSGAVFGAGYTFDATTNTIVIPNVVYEPGNWTVTFDDALHAPFDDDKVKVERLPDAVTGFRNATLVDGVVADRSRLTGLATEQPGVGPPQALSGTATLTLTGLGMYTIGPTTPEVDTPTANARLLNGTRFIFDVPAGVYNLTASKPDFFPVQLANRNLAPAGTVVTGEIVNIQKQATIVATARNRGLTIPPNVRLELVSNDGTVYGPSSLSAAATDPTASFAVRAGAYRARTTIVGTTYPQQVTPTDSDVVVGAVAVPIDLTLSRVTRFNVTGPSTATVTIPTLGPGRSAPAGTTIEFVETTTTGTLTATVSGTDHRSRQVTVPADLLTTNNVTLLGNVTVTGTIAGASDGTITAVNAANVTDTRAGTISGGSYSIAGLDNNADGTSKTWNISYTETGIGTGSATPIVVSDVSSATETRNITLDPRPVNYNFTVTTGASTPVPGATVTITPAPTTAAPPTSATGTTTAVVAENASVSWTVKRAGFLTRYGSFTRAPAHPNVAVNVPMVAGVSGTVTGTTLAGTIVEVCPSGATAACAPGAARTFNTTGNATSRTFNITSDLVPDSYTVVAYVGSPARIGTATLTIDDDGDAMLSPTTIAMPDPPGP